MKDRIEVFKAGKHRAMNGQEFEFTEADVAGIAAAYDPALLAAPMVLGHPKTDDPAYGWAKSLSVENGVLVATPEKVNPAFAQGVDDGAYRYVSAKFYTPQDPANPKPGSWYLRHIGYLGAVPPAVKGLEAAFSTDPEDGGVAFAQIDVEMLRDLFRRFRDWLIDDKGLDVADQVLPSWYIDNLQADDSTRFAEATEAAPAGAETVAGDAGQDSITAATGAETTAAPAGEDVAFAERSAALDTREANISQREVAFAEGERSRARQADTTYLDGLVSAGRLPPVHRDGLAAVFARLDGDDSVAFAAPTDDARSVLRGVLDALGVSIEFAEVSGSDGFTGSADPNALAREITRRVDEAKARGETLSYSQAAAQIGR